MAKTKRKPSAKQRDKNIIHIASVLKKAGIISKQAKLHGGHYVSRDVARKVEKYSDIAHLGYKAIKVDKKLAQAAKERGFEVVAGNKIIGPATPTFRNRLKKGELTGVKPVKGGYMEQVILPHTVFDMHTLVDQLESGIDTLKLPEEQFAFTYQGAESYRAFMNTEDLLQYLRHYKSSFTQGGSLKAEDLTEEFQNFAIFRLHPRDIRRNIPSMEQRKKRRREQRARDRAAGILPENVRYRPSRNEIMQDWNPARRRRALDRMNKREAAKRAKIAADPVAYEEYKRLGRERARKSYEKRKERKEKK